MYFWTWSSIIYRTAFVPKRILFLASTVKTKFTVLRVEIKRIVIKHVAIEYGFTMINHRLHNLLQ